MTLQLAPVDDKIVVSDIGEQWSPKTAPANTAPKAGSSRSGSLIEFMMSPAIGIKIPNDPHDVPVENAIAPAIKNITGISHCGSMLAPSTKPPR